MLDENGDRINRRNAQDIRTPLYNHQIPPGAADSLHFGILLPDDLTDHVTIEVKLQYRKFDAEFVRIIAEALAGSEMELPGYVSGQPYINTLPIVTMAEDRITLPVQGMATELPPQPGARHSGMGAVE